MRAPVDKIVRHHYGARLCLPHADLKRFQIDLTQTQNTIRGIAVRFLIVAGKMLDCCGAVRSTLNTAHECRSHAPTEQRILRIVFKDSAL